MQQIETVGWKLWSGGREMKQHSYASMGVPMVRLCQKLGGKDVDNTRREGNCEGVVTEEIGSQTSDRVDDK